MSRVSNTYPEWCIENSQFSAHLLIPDLVGEPLVYVQGVTLKTIGIIVIFDCELSGHLISGGVFNRSPVKRGMTKRKEKLKWD